MERSKKVLDGIGTPTKCIKGKWPKNWEEELCSSLTGFNQIQMQLIEGVLCKSLLMTYISSNFN